MAAARRPAIMAASSNPRTEEAKMAVMAAMAKLVKGGG
jgi:hypothetical protein